jgi:putative endonuclease
LKKSSRIKKTVAPSEKFLHNPYSVNAEGKIEVTGKKIVHVKKSTWCVYMIRCSDASLYTGVTTDIERRFNEHKEGKVGAKYTRAKIPLHVVYEEACASRSEAQVREAQIKKLSKEEKESLIPKAKKAVKKK